MKTLQLRIGRTRFVPGFLFKMLGSQRKHLPLTFQIPEPPSGFKDDSVIPKKKAESPSSSSSSTSGHESPITVGETKPVLSQQEQQQQQAAVAVSHDSGTELSSDKSEDKPSAEVTTPSPPPATANGNSEADDTYSYCSGRNSELLVTWKHDRHIFPDQTALMFVFR